MHGVVVCRRGVSNRSLVISKYKKAPRSHCKMSSVAQGGAAESDEMGYINIYMLTATWYSYCGRSSKW
jgi:hypothetical protein